MYLARQTVATLNSWRKIRKLRRGVVACSMGGAQIHNGMIAEWLALEAEKARGHLERAFSRAARVAFMWPVEAAHLIATGVPLTTLPSVGPYLAKVIEGWLKEPPPYVPPPMRRNFLTMAQADAILKSNPGWTRRYRGDLHMHTTWSDGATSVREMAEEAYRRGYEYINISDHAKGLKIAGGMDETELAQQAAEIEEVNQQFQTEERPFHILRSVELNLDLEGAGDFDAATTARLELIIGSFHSALRKTENQTERYLAALNNPDVQILGHPRGRIYNHRQGLTADWKTVFAEAARLGKALEINSYADRQDLDIELLALARNAGVKIAIDTDAHRPSEMEQIKLGLAAAMLAQYPAELIINFMPLKELLSWAKSVRRGPRRPTRQQKFEFA
jgi:histidinol phosphatase-like PHP family hydrolase